MPYASPLLRPGPGRQDLVNDVGPSLTPLHADGNRAVLDRLVAGWRVPSDVVDELDLLLAEVADLAERQGHGLVAINVEFAQRRVRVSVADEAAPGEEGVRWFELGPAHGGPGAQLELRHG